MLQDLAVYLKTNGQNKASAIPRKSNLESKLTVSELKSLTSRLELRDPRLELKDPRPDKLHSQTCYKITLHRGNKFTELLTADSSLFNSWSLNLQSQCINRSLVSQFKVQDLMRVGMYHRTYSVYSLEPDDLNMYLVKCYARNQLKAEPQVLEQLKREIEILRMVDHPRISRLLYLFEDENMVSLVFSQTKGASLLKIIQYRLQLKESAILLIVKDILEALVYMHSLNIVHRKISARTIYLSDNGRPSKRNRILLAGTGKLAIVSKKNPTASESVAETDFNLNSSDKQDVLKLADV